MNWKPHLPEIFLGISLALIAVEAALAGAAMIKARYRLKDTLASLGMQAGNIAMNLMMAGIVFAGLSAVYQVRLFSISPGSPWAWVAIFFLDDFIYYWFHRISHECRFWWAAHVNHHSSQEYNLSTAVRQSWTSVIVGTWMPWIPLAFLGFPPTMILAQQGFNLFYQFWIHTEVVQRMPAWFEYLFNTPSHHRVHHASNPRYLDRNYAGVLMALAALRNRQEHRDFQSDSNRLPRMGGHRSRRGGRAFDPRGGRRGLRAPRVARRRPRTDLEKYTRPRMSKAAAQVIIPPIRWRRPPPPTRRTPSARRRR